MLTSQTTRSTSSPCRLSWGPCVGWWGSWASSSSSPCCTNCTNAATPATSAHRVTSFISLSLLPSLTHTLPLSPLNHSPSLTVSLSLSLSHLHLYSLTHSLSQTLSFSLSLSLSLFHSLSPSNFFYTLSLFGFTCKLRLMSYNEE